jgi:hypothetical protein
LVAAIVVIVAVIYAYSGGFGSSLVDILFPPKEGDNTGSNKEGNQSDCAYRNGTNGSRLDWIFGIG